MCKDHSSMSYERALLKIVNFSDFVAGKAESHSDDSVSVVLVTE